MLLMSMPVLALPCTFWCCVCCDCMSVSDDIVVQCCGIMAVLARVVCMIVVLVWIGDPVA